MRDQIMSDIEVLRIAAICAVLSIIDSQSDKTSEIGRNTGSPWTQGHIRMNMGLNSLMSRNSGRSPWR